MSISWPINFIVLLGVREHGSVEYDRNNESYNLSRLLAV